MIRAKLSHLHRMILLIILPHSPDLSPKHSPEPLQVSSVPTFWAPVWAQTLDLPKCPLLTSWTLSLHQEKTSNSNRSQDSSLLYPQTAQNPGHGVQGQLGHTWADPCGLIPSPPGAPWLLSWGNSVSPKCFPNFWSTLDPVLTQYHKNLPDNSY